ncbi:hypothetical protein ABZ942_32870 [Nocardia sp. NPDC046473]|uniref:hypothetical protein n=1 Tax=Nocardia sp. NPDC046473 TaxID=3155733 RepID=UPI00341037BA
MSEEYRSDRLDDHSSDRVEDHPPRPSRKILATLAVILFSTALLGTVLPVAIWPGEAKLTAPLFCEAPYTEPIVVSDTFSDAEGQSTNYSMYCVGDRGQYTEVGFLRPWLALWALHSAIVITLVILVGLWGRWRHPRATEPERLTESTEL